MYIYIYGKKKNYRDHRPDFVLAGSKRGRWLFLRPPGSESGSHEDADAVGVVPASPDGAQRSAMFYLHLTKGKVHIEK